MDRMLVTSPPTEVEAFGGACPTVTASVDVMSGQAVREAVGNAFRFALQYGVPVTVAGLVGRAILYCADRRCEHASGPLRVLPDVYVTELEANGVNPEGKRLRAGARSALVVGAPERVWSL